MALYLNGKPLVLAEGLAASDSPEVGNPFQIGGSVDDTTPASAGEGDARRARVTPEGNVIVEPYKDNTPLTQTTAGNSIADDTTPTLLATALLYGFNPGGATNWQQVTAKSHKDSDASTNDLVGLTVRTYPSLYNGGADATSMDRVRNNVQTNNYIAASLVSASQNGADRTNYNGKGLLVFVDVTARNGTSTITIAVQVKDGNGNYLTLATAAAALSAVGQASYLLYPTAGVVGVTEHFQTVLAGRTFRVIATYGGADTISFDVDLVELMA